MMAIQLLKIHFPLIGKFLVFCSLPVFLFYGCTTVTPPPTPPGHPKPYKIGKNWYKPLPHARGFSQRGMASWYGGKFHGRKTANGEIYNMYAMTAAHKTLPLGTYLTVRNLQNNRKIDVRINDRGPFVRGRILDLSYTAAKKLGIVGPGTAKVEIVALGTIAQPKLDGSTDRSYIPGNYYQGKFTVQIGAFSELKNAQRLKQKLGQSYKNIYITICYNGYSALYRVRVGRCSSLEQAIQREEFMIQNGFKDAFAIAEDN
ncbi:MAG: septal ring lytic transglycosylase RlpA family protein [Thermodesulfobacteriota bacterium]|nr:septal ring lytic transglycosylase RlpA family protein [Thermodesulfobacteriota bacterium]